MSEFFLVKKTRQDGPRVRSQQEWFFCAETDAIQFLSKAILHELTVSHDHFGTRVNEIICLLKNGNIEEACRDVYVLTECAFDLVKITPQEKGISGQQELFYQLEDEAMIRSSFKSYFHVFFDQKAYPYFAKGADIESIDIFVRIDKEKTEQFFKDFGFMIFQKSLDGVETKTPIQIRDFIKNEHDWRRIRIPFKASVEPGATFNVVMYVPADHKIRGDVDVRLNQADSDPRQNNNLEIEESAVSDHYDC